MANVSVQLSQQSTTDLNTAVFSGPNFSRSFIEEWSELCDQGTVEYPFCRPEWILAQAEVENHTGQLRIFAVYMDNKLEGLLPLRLEKKRLYGLLPVMTLMSAGGLFTSRFDLMIAAESVRQKVVEATWHQLQKEQWDILIFNDIPDGGILEDLVNLAREGRCPIRRENMKNSPYRKFNLPEISGDSKIRPVSKNKAKEIRQLERKLAAEGGCEMLHCCENDPTVWGQFLRIENSGWKGRAGSSVLSSSEEKLFLEKILESATKRQYLVWHILTFHNEILAIAMCFIYKNRVYGCKLAYDEKFSEYSPGHLLIHMDLRDAAEKGFLEYDFLGEDDEHKLKWTSTVRGHNQWHVYRPSFLMRLLGIFQGSILPLYKRTRKRLSKNFSCD